jgi:molecular chaperone HscC
LTEDGSILVGLPALERVSSHAARTATAFKRYMGTDHQIRLGDRRFRAEELSAIVLRSLKADAEAYLGEPVTEAVITVPAYFNDLQRHATKSAGEIAGLRVERLLNEPTAAGLAYGIQEAVGATTFLVFDLGGGTFDVSVLEYFEGVVEVRASAGDTRLGGEDFVRVMIDWFLEAIPEGPAKRHMMAEDAKALWRSAEQAKRDLSDRDQTAIIVHSQGQRYEYSVTRNEYEMRCQALLGRCRHPIERALSDARLDAASLDQIVLVGGASRMPMIRSLTTRLFGKLPLRTINPDEAIARGAAVQAGLKARDAALQEIVLTDVMPFSLGVTISTLVDGTRIGDRFSPIIERNMPVPISRVHSYTSTSDNQASVELEIRQGESPVASENLLLGKLSVPIPRVKAGGVTIPTRFTYDINGLLEVEAQVAETGEKFQTVIQRSDRLMSDAEIKAALDAMSALKIHPRDKQENAYLLARCKRLYEDRLGDERAAVAAALAKFELALETQDDFLIRQHQGALKSFLDSIDKGFVW